MAVAGPGRSSAMMAFALALGLAALASTAAAEETSAQAGGQGQIRGRVSIPQKFGQELPPGQGLMATKVILDGGVQSALPTSDGYFVINNVAPGAHLLQVVHPRLIFDPVRLEAQEVKGTTTKMTAYMADLEHGRGAKLKYPLGLAPSGMFAYLEKREEFNILSVFKNPMAIVSLISFGFMFLLPKLQPMLEEDKRQRLEAEQRETAAREGGGGREGSGRN